VNWVDLLLAAVVLSGAWTGWRRGFVQAMLFLATLVVSVIASFSIYRYPADWLAAVLAALGVWVPPLAFTATFVLLHAILDSIAALVIGSVPRRVHLHAGNRLLGVAPGLVGGLINAAIVAVALTIFPLSDGVTRETRESGLARALGEPAAEMETQLAKIFDPRSSARCRR
jgi:uncharacterized membrane protein required for colicin V production